MIFLGIDPGKHGAIAALADDGRVIRVAEMPPSERGVLNVFAWASKRPVFAMLERVSASPQMGVVSAFTFGRGYGALITGLQAAAIEFYLVTPQQWQKALGCRSAGDKNVTKRRAQALFPALPVTHAIADALLLAEYARRYRGRLLPHSARR